MNAAMVSLDYRLDRFSRRLVLLSALVLAPVIAGANPIPPNVVVLPCDALNGVVLCPDTPEPIPSSVVYITYRNDANEPVPDAVVTIHFGTGPLCICSTMVYTTTTDENGEAVLTLRGGGCIDDVDMAAWITIDGVIVRNYRNVKSPDWDGSTGDCQVGLRDLVRFVSDDRCFDFDNNGQVDISDLIIFSSGFSPAHYCAR